MKIPSTFQIGKYTYTVEIVKRIKKDGTCWGRSYIYQNRIKLSTHTASRALTPAEIEATFWHEVMHCMLHDMGHSLWNDEAFVNAVGENLQTIIATATFKD